MPFPFVPALMAGKMALDLIGGYQARRDARKQNERMNAQNAMGRFLSRLSPGAERGVAGAPQIPIPNLAQQLGSAADPLLSILMSQGSAGKQATNAAAGQAAPSMPALPKAAGLAGSGPTNTSAAGLQQELGLRGGADPEVLQRIMSLLQRLPRSGMR